MARRWQKVWIIPRSRVGGTSFQVVFYDPTRGRRVYDRSFRNKHLTVLSAAGAADSDPHGRHWLPARYDSGLFFALAACDRRSDGGARRLLVR